jgi:hypothetical protein
MALKEAALERARRTQDGRSDGFPVSQECKLAPWSCPGDGPDTDQITRSNGDAQNDPTHA